MEGKKMKRLILLACCVLLAVSCAPSWKWAKAGATQAEYEQAVRECNFESDKATGSMRNLDDMVIRGARVFHSCMEAKGYHKEPIN
jgi:hypothetical protein